MSLADIDAREALAYATAGVSALILMVSAALRIWAPPRVISREFESERTFASYGRGGKKVLKAFGSIIDLSGNVTPPEVSLSVVVPAYNEESRIRVMLDEALTYLRKRSMRNPSFSYEVLVVDDGSSDGTANIVLEYAQKASEGTVRLLSLGENHGKGGAVCKGMVRGRGARLLMADADGATLFADIERLEAAIDSLDSASAAGAIAVGSRAHLAQDATVKRSFFKIS